MRRPAMAFPTSSGISLRRSKRFLEYLQFILVYKFSRGVANRLDQWTGGQFFRHRIGRDWEFIR
jgi:hypothetical protein